MDSITMLSVCSGIGSPELGAEKVYKEGLNILGAVEIDKFAQQTYKANFNIKDESLHDDITKFDATPYKGKVDLFVGGFPCQAFSTNGKGLGFEDTRGTIFFDCARAIKESEPKVFILENVKGLISHDKPKPTTKTIKEINLFGEETERKVTIKPKDIYSRKKKDYKIGRTLATIESTLDELGYYWSWEILNSKDFGIPQNRERIFLIGFKDERHFNNFKFPAPIKLQKSIKDFLVKDVPNSYLLTKKQKIATFGSSFVTTKTKCYKKDSIVGTLSARDFKDPKCVILNNRSGKRKGGVEDTIRKLTPREYLNLQGFPSSYKQVVSDSQLYKQVGNSMTVEVMEALVMEIAKATEEEDEFILKLE